MRNKS